MLRWEQLILKKGDVLGVIALSAACEKERFQAGEACLSGTYGFRSRVMLSPWESYGSTRYLFSSDSVSARVAALDELFRDPEVQVILSARGAYGCVELMPHLDFQALSKGDKTLIGFSDTTALLLAFYQRAGLRAIHGPSLESAFAKATRDESAKQSCEVLVQLLRGERPQPFAAPLRRICGAAEASGPLIGGNLTVLCSLMGTPWEPDLSGHLLFLEECGEKPYRIHRMLTQMKQAGKFSEVRGVLLGSFKDCVHEKGLGPTTDQALLDIFGSLPFGVFAGAQFGHVNPNYPLPLGMKARVSEAGMLLEYA